MKVFAWPRLGLVALAFVQFSAGQTGTPSQQRVPEVILYKHFFDHVAAFRHQSDALSLMGAENPFRYYFQQRLGLSWNESDRVDAVALEFQEALAANSAKRLAVVRQFQAEHFPNNVLSAGSVPPPPPPELKQLALERKQLVTAAKEKLAAFLSPEAMGRLDIYVHTRVAADSYVVSSGRSGK
jgi:hypothetical protein